jgi:hypothetical protein
MTDFKDECPVASTRIAIIIVGVVVSIAAMYFVIFDMSEAQRVNICW